MNHCLKAENFTTTNWAGGTTTQLFIYPPTANYQDLNFYFRLSTAKVELEKSDFTSLPGVSRKIMILDGEIEIRHEKHHKKKLRKFDQDTFEGDWKTSAAGRCTDFNLMCTNNTKGELQTLRIDKNHAFNFNPGKNWDYVFVYLYTGKISANLSTKAQNLFRGDLLVVQNPISTPIVFYALENSELVFSKIRL